MKGRHTRAENRDDLGFDENRDYIARALSAVVPQWLARRAVTISVETDRERYEQGEPVSLTVLLRNRLPVPIAVETPRQRLWGWSVDGQLEASDEKRYEPERSGTLRFEGRETKRIDRVWNGRFEDSNARTWELADPGEHEIEAFLATWDRRPRDSTVVTID